MAVPVVGENSGHEFDEVFEHFLVETGCLPATTITAASQARWRGSQWLRAVAISSGMLTVREASAVLQLEATLGETFGACAQQLGFLTLQQIAELTLLAYRQRRSLCDCLVEDHAIDIRGLAARHQVMQRAIDNPV